MVGHDAPGFRAVVDAIAKPPVPLSAHYKDYATRLEQQIRELSLTNNQLAHQICLLSETNRALNLKLLEAERDRLEA